MRNALFLLVLGFAVVATPMVARAEQVRPNKASQHGIAASETRSKTVRRARQSRPPANPCAQYGAGFFAAPGSTTCMKIGGSISAGVGVSR